MKNRKTVIVAFLLVAALMLSVGYAAVSNVLDIQGSVSVSAEAADKEFNEDIYFSGVLKDGVLVASVVAGDDKGYTANINTNNNDKAQFTVTGIQKEGDKAVITYRIQNDSDYEATVAPKAAATNTNTTDFSFDCYFGTTGTTTTTIAAGGTADVTVEVELIKQLTAASSASFVVELNATAG